jgi:formylglycine-generating enzyme required for sulfatase activity
LGAIGEARWLLERIAEARRQWLARGDRRLKLVGAKAAGPATRAQASAGPPPSGQAPAGQAPVRPKLTLVRRGSPTFVDSLGLEYVPISPGSFVMGADDRDSDARSWEKPARLVVISRPFMMAKLPVVQGQWEEIMGVNPSFFFGWDRPVESVDYGEIEQFIARLNRREGKTRRHRLPTEAEWEYAARAGVVGPCPFGSNLGYLAEHAWFSGNSGGGAQTVGLKRANPWGLFDMIGNVWELVSDWFGDYGEGPEADPKGPVEGTEKVARGGCWGSSPRFCRCFSRTPHAPWEKSPLVGFRLVWE